MSLDHATNGKETRAWQFDQFGGQDISFLDIDDSEGLYVSTDASAQSKTPGENF